MRRVLAFPVLALTAGPAAACNICHSPTSLGVRHLLFSHDFWLNAAAVAAPLPVLALAIVLVAREPRR
ncbi:MAG: hypothetical protein DCF31_16240 [Alphaproteobacteria bacterium]|nr:MAG: hypothetical protein DCF31_16240 [Alphaproteobacteria bacterium]